MRGTARCDECRRVFDLFDEEEASEFYYGHDCEADVGDCRCAECGVIHAEFITRAGKWPSMSHAEGQELVTRRRNNERSWENVTGGTG